MVKVAAAPGATVAVPELEPVPEPEESVRPVATAKLVFRAAAA